MYSLHTYTYTYTYKVSKLRHSTLLLEPEATAVAAITVESPPIAALRPQDEDDLNNGSSSSEYNSRFADSPDATTDAAATIITSIISDTSISATSTATTNTTSVGVTSYSNTSFILVCEVCSCHIYIHSYPLEVHTLI